MKGIGGNIIGTLEIRNTTQNEYGDCIESWISMLSLKGWLDQMSGQAGYQSYSAKIQESTHVFVSDYVNIPADSISENSRMVINGKRYDVVMIDNPMELNQQLEIYLKYTGGQ